jgi:hypothetical protein
MGRERGAGRRRGRRRSSEALVCCELSDACERRVHRYLVGASERDATPRSIERQPRSLLGSHRTCDLLAWCCVASLNTAPRAPERQARDGCRSPAACGEHALPTTSVALRRNGRSGPRRRRARGARKASGAMARQHGGHRSPLGFGHGLSFTQSQYAPGCRKPLPRVERWLNATHPMGPVRLA